MALLAVMSRDALSLNNLSHSLAIPLVELEVMLHLSDLNARLQVENARGYLQILTLNSFHFQFSCIEMQTF